MQEAKEHFIQFESCCRIGSTDFMVYELGEKSLAKALYEMKGDFHNGERVYRIKITPYYQQFVENIFSFIQQGAAAIDAMLQQGIRYAEALVARLSRKKGAFRVVLSRDPDLDDVTVRAIDPKAAIRLATGDVIAMGRAVALDFAQGVLVLAEQRWQTYGPSIFADLGVDLKAMRVILVKSAQHDKPHFMPVTPSGRSLP